MSERRPKKISEFEKSGIVPFSSRHKNRKYNIRHPKLKALTASREHPSYDLEKSWYLHTYYKRISQAKPDIAKFSIEAYIEKASISRYKYERYRGANKFSDIANRVRS